VHVYPNPAAGSFSVITSRDGARITVTTLEGKVVMKTVTATGTVTAIDAGNWQAGMYLVQVQSGTETTTKKVVITK
jgi:hypothetical protein